MRNDRWTTDSIIKKTLSMDTDKSGGGPVLYYDRGHYYAYTSEGHIIYLGVSGAGKSRRGTIPEVRSIIKGEESFIVLDPKGEIYAATSNYLSNKYKRIVIDFRKVYESACVNLLAAPYELYKSGDPEKKQVAIEMIDDLAITLYPENHNADPFWADSARSVFIGAIFTLFEIADPAEINMTSVYSLIAKGDDKLGIGDTYLKKLVNSLPHDSTASILLQSYVTTASDTKAGIRSTFFEGLSMFSRSEGLQKMMSSDDLHVNELDGETPTAIYIIVPDETPVYDGISCVILSQLIRHYIRLAYDKYNGKLKRRVNFIVEEAGNVGRIGPLGHLMSAGRSRNVRVSLVLQSYSQLDALYGEKEASTIRSNADVLIAFRTNHWETLQELSKKCGEHHGEYNNSPVSEPLITPTALGSMETGQALVMISGRTRYISWIPDYTEMFVCSKSSNIHTAQATADRDKYSNRSARVFNIVEYITTNEKSFVRGDIRRSQFERTNPFGSNSKPEVPSFAPDHPTGDRPSETAASQKYSFVLISYTGTKQALITAIRDNTDVPSLAAAREILEDLPHKFYFQSLESCKKAARAISLAGGMIIPPKQ